MSSEKNKSLFTIIVPIHNGGSTIQKTLESITSQKEINSLVEVLILINDHSTDNSLQLIKDFKKNNKINTKIIDHSKSYGLGASLNEAIKIAKTQYIITIHQDIIINSTIGLTTLAKIINRNPNVFYIHPIVCHPKYIWDQYNFWQKCLFSRYVNTEHHVPIEKFDCINRQKFIEIGLFDQKHFRAAGEDIDLIVRAKKENLEYLDSQIKVTHIHNKNPNFSFKNLVKKEKQLAETKGVLLRLHGPKIPNLRSFYRECLVLGLIFPITRPFSLFFLTIFIFGYNWRMYQLIGKDSRVFLLPFINLYLFYANISASTIAFFNKKQII